MADVHSVAVFCGSRPGNNPAWIANRLAEYGFGLGGNGSRKRLRIGAIGPHNPPIEFLKRLIELVDRPAVQLPTGDKFVTRFQ